MALAAIVVTSVIGISVLLNGETSNSSSAPSTGLPGAPAVLSLFRRVPQHGLVLGDPAAPTTLVEYLDLQCPWCGAFARDTFPSIVSQYVRTGRVRVEIRPLDFVGSDSVRGRNALFAAARRNMAFQFVALLYANQGAENSGWLSAEMIRAAAASVPGLDYAAVVGAGFSGAFAGRIERQRANDRVTGVPTFFVRHSGGDGRGKMLVNPSEVELESAFGGA